MSPEKLIRIDRGAEVSPGVWAYRVAGLPISGQSRQPLLDACRAIRRMGGDPAERACLFREGKVEADISCTVGWGAAHTVEERSAGNICFAKFKSFDPREVIDHAA
jgi:hypothetical protein